MKIRVEGDGSPTGTRIVSVETGEEIADVTSVEFRHEAGSLPLVDLRVALVEVKYEGEARLIGPKGRQVRSIEYMDGEVDYYDGTVHVDTHSQKSSRRYRGELLEQQPTVEDQA